jgi:hypothetical protein
MNFKSSGRGIVLVGSTFTFQEFIKSAMRPPKDAKQWKIRYNIDNLKMSATVVLARVDKYCERLEKSFCQAHNPEVVGSNPTPATNRKARHCNVLQCLFY